MVSGTSFSRRSARAATSNKKNRCARIQRRTAERTAAARAGATSTTKVTRCLHGNKSREVPTCTQSGASPGGQYGHPSGNYSFESTLFALFCMQMKFVRFFIRHLAFETKNKRKITLNRGSFKRINLRTTVKTVEVSKKK